MNSETMDTPHRDSEEHRSTVPMYKSQTFAEEEWEVIELSEKQQERFEAEAFEVVETPVDAFNPMFPDFSEDRFIVDPLLSPHVRSESRDQEGDVERFQGETQHDKVEEQVQQEVLTRQEAVLDESDHAILAEDVKATESYTEQVGEQDQELLPPESSVVQEAEGQGKTSLDLEKPVEEELIHSGDDGTVEDQPSDDEPIDDQHSDHESSATEMKFAEPSDESEVEDILESRDEEVSELTEAVAEEPTAIEPDPLEDAFEAGYQKGCEESREEVQYAQQQLAEQYTLLWEDMQVQLDEMKADHEQKAVDLAMHVAKKLVGKVVEDQPEYIVDVIHEALESISNATIKVVRVSPQSYEFLSLGDYGERIKIHGDQKLSFKADESIRAGCIVETSAGETDFDLEKTWTRIYNKVVGGATT